MKVLLLVAAALALAGPAAAHSLLLEASPAPDAVVAQAPPRIALRFNNRIEKKLSRIRVVDDRGQARALVLAVDGPEEQVVAGLPPLPPGAYRVEWNVLSTDGHVVSGRFSFRVAP